MWKYYRGSVNTTTSTERGWVQAKSAKKHQNPWEETSKSPYNVENIFAADVHTYTHTHSHMHARTHTYTVTVLRAHARPHSYTSTVAALNVGHWALLSLKRAETVPKPPLQSERFLTLKKTTHSARPLRFDSVFSDNTFKNV